MSREIDRLRNIVRETIINEMGAEPRSKSIHDTVVDITKAAAAGMKAIQSLSSKAMPTEKAAHAVSTQIKALEMIFQDMSTNPTRYLDQGEPGEIVKRHLDKLDDRETALRDSQEPSGRDNVVG